MLLECMFVVIQRLKNMELARSLVVVFDSTQLL